MSYVIKNGTKYYDVLGDLTKKQKKACRYTDKESAECGRDEGDRIVKLTPKCGKWWEVKNPDSLLGSKSTTDELIDEALDKLNDALDAVGDLRIHLDNLDNEK